MKTVNNIDQFLAHVATGSDEHARVDRRPTIEVIWASNGQGELNKGRPEVLRVARFIYRGTQRLAQTESGDCWPFRKHKNPHVADYFAIPA